MKTLKDIQEEIKNLIEEAIFNDNISITFIGDPIYKETNYCEVYITLFGNEDNTLRCSVNKNGYICYHNLSPEPNISEDATTKLCNKVNNVIKESRKKYLIDKIEECQNELYNLNN